MHINSKEEFASGCTFMFLLIAKQIGTSAYDLEESVQKALSSYSKHTEVPLSHDFAM